jgi:hypothetical protein
MPIEVTDGGTPWIWAGARVMKHNASIPTQITTLGTET